MDPKSVIFQIFQSLVTEGLDGVRVEAIDCDYLGDLIHPLDDSDSSPTFSGMEEEE